MDIVAQNKSLLQVDIPLKCTKSDIKTLAANIVENSIEDGRSIKTAEGIAVMEKLIKAIREDQRFVSAVVDDLQGSKTLTTISGTLIEQVEAGVKYDYSYDEEWRNIDEQIKSLTEVRKARETILKSFKEGKEGVDENTGEIIVGANKSSKTTYRITLAK